jgi:hypothetical protein
MPMPVRRVLTSNRRYVIYYRCAAETAEIVVLAIRGEGQLPPAPEDLAGDVP